jgi:hypothetical protein
MRGILFVVVIFTTGLIIGVFVGSSSASGLQKNIMLFGCAASFGVALKVLRRDP